MLALLSTGPVTAKENLDHTEHRRFNIFVDITSNSSTIVTKSTASTSNASTSAQIIAAEIGGDYFLLPKVALTAELLFTLMSSVDAGIKGYDLGVRYYPIWEGYQSEATLLGSTVESTPGWAPFAYAGFSTREFSLASSSISFQGYELGGGIDYHFEQHYFLRAGLNYQMLQNTSSRTYTGIATGIAFGYSF